MVKSKSMFHPYYNKIQALLFEGATIKEAHDYMVKYFDLYSSYKSFYAYVKKQKLDWFMPKPIEEKSVFKEDVEDGRTREDFGRDRRKI